MTAIEFHHQIMSLECSMGRFASRLTGINADAKDLVQETILKVLTNQDKFNGDTNFKAWTFTIMKNTFINNYRRKTRYNSNIDYNNEVFLINEIRSSGGDDPISTLLALEIRQHIEKLRDAFKIPFKMHMSGYKYQEIAEELNLNIGTVKSRIFLTRQKLMNLIDA